MAHCIPISSPTCSMVYTKSLICYDLAQHPGTERLRIIASNRKDNIERDKFTTRECSGEFPRFLPSQPMPQLAPILEPEEYIEQAYFFHAFKLRQEEGQPSQEILSRLHEEIL